MMSVIVPQEFLKEYGTVGGSVYKEVSEVVADKGCEIGYDSRSRRITILKSSDKGINSFDLRAIVHKCRQNEECLSAVYIPSISDKRDDNGNLQIELHRKDREDLFIETSFKPHW